MSEATIRQFVTSDGYEHNYRHWEPAERPRGFIVALHGIQSHSGWYEYSSGKLCEAGYDVVFVDRRGSGMNREDRGHARHQRRLVNDVSQFVRDVRERRNDVAPTAPVSLLGLSWSGKLAAVTAARRQELVDGLILLYPGIHSRIRASWWDNFRLSLAKFGEKDDNRVPVPIDDPRLFTGEKKWQDFIREDDLSLREVSVGFLLANRDLDRLVPRTIRDIRCPALMMLSGQDEIIDNERTKSWFESLAAQDRTLLEYENARHTLEFEPDRDRFVEDLIGWLEQLRKTT